MRVLKVVLGIGLMIFSQSVVASSDNKTGNGGGAWVCRELDSKIRWTKLVDLFEATDEFGLTLSQYTGSTQEVVEQAQLRLSRANPDLSNALAPYFQRLGDLEPNPPNVTHTDHIVQTIDDSFYRIKPAPETCAGGVVTYEQLVNYKNDGMILVEKSLFGALSTQAKAALIFHEAIYTHRREWAGDTDSIATRRIVGLIFSTLSTEELKRELSALGELEMFPFGSEPQHRVTLTHSFEMQTTTVTQAQYALIMGVNPSFFRKPEHCKSTFEVRHGIAMCPDNPVENLNYNEVQSFIAKLNGIHLDRYHYRLPTEAEWEYTARAGTTTIYYFGNDWSQSAHYGWLDANWMTYGVAQLKPNAFGLYDMLGNVTQWTSDWFDFYGIGPVTDPVGPTSGVSHVVRPGSCVPGGGWLRNKGSERSASRGSGEPESREKCRGFRLVRTL